MLLCIKKGSEQEVIDIFHKWDLDAAVVGEVTDTKTMELFWHKEKCANVPIDPVSEEAPILNRPTKRPTYLDKLRDITLNDFKEINNQDAFITLFSSMEVVDKSWIYQQYDSMVQANTIKKGGALDASVIRVKQINKALAMSADCNVRYCYIDPRAGAAAAVIKSGRNVAMSGARPLAITDCLNYGNPENPEVMWQFAQGCEGIKEACLQLHTPVIGGNVSLYNETDGISVYPTPSIVTVGVNHDAQKILFSQFANSGNILYLLGDTKSEFGGSLYMKELYDTVAGKVPEINYAKELALWDIIIKANEKNLLSSTKDCGAGGVAIALAKMSAVSGLGCNVGMDVKDTRDIFCESFSRAIVEVSVDKVKEFEEFVSNHILISKIGTVGGDHFTCNNVIVSVDKLRDIYYNTFNKIMNQDL